MKVFSDTAEDAHKLKGFEYALRKPNATLVNEMLKECLENEEYTSASKIKGPQYSTESLFVALIFRQQKMISGLIKKIGSDQKSESIEREYKEKLNRKRRLGIVSKPPWLHG